MNIVNFTKNNLLLTSAFIALAGVVFYLGYRIYKIILSSDSSPTLQKTHQLAQKTVTVRLYFDDQEGYLPQENFIPDLKKYFTEKNISLKIVNSSEEPHAAFIWYQRVPSRIDYDELESFIKDQQELLSSSAIVWSGPIHQTIPRQVKFQPERQFNSMTNFLYGNPYGSFMGGPMENEGRKGNAIEIQKLAEFILKLDKEKNPNPS